MDSNSVEAVWQTAIADLIAAYEDIKNRGVRCYQAVRRGPRDKQYPAIDIPADGELTLVVSASLSGHFYAKILERGVEIQRRRWPPHDRKVAVGWCCGFVDACSLFDVSEDDEEFDAHGDPSPR